jgi:hypothetical protein
MALNIVKLCVGAVSIEDLAQWQQERLAERTARGMAPRMFHVTAQTPKRQVELAGGSLYWVIKGVIQVRQALLGFEEGKRDNGTPCCHILLDPKLVPVRPVPRRAFQGWRYLPGDEAPKDLGRGRGDDLARMPPDMRRALTELGLL